MLKAVAGNEQTAPAGGQLGRLAAVRPEDVHLQADQRAELFIVKELEFERTGRGGDLQAAVTQYARSSVKVIFLKAMPETAAADTPLGGARHLQQAPRDAPAAQLVAFCRDPANGENLSRFHPALQARDLAPLESELNFLAGLYHRAC